MSFQVILKRCANEQVAQRVTQEVAAMSGAPAEQILGAVTTKSISIGKDFSEEKAIELKAKFEAFGAEVTVKNLSVAPVAAAAASTAGTAKAATAASKSPLMNQYEDDDDEEDDEGRLLSEDEYVKMLNERADIFDAERDKKLRAIIPFCLIMGVVFAVALINANFREIDTDFKNTLRESQVSIAEDVDLSEPLDEDKEEEVVEQIEQQKEELRPSQGSGGETGGGGDPTAHVTRQGVLGIISGAITGQSAASSSADALGGYASGIDAVLQGVGGLTAGGGDGSGRESTAGIGFGSGVGSGFGGNSGGVNDLLGSLMGGGGSNLALDKPREVAVRQPTGSSGAGMTGGRSRANIMRVVRQNTSSLQYAYTRRLANTPGLRGKITVKWAIDEFGKVLFCQVVSSTINDPQLEAEVVNKIKRWAFGRINKPGDVTEVVYPFVFNQQ